MNYSFEPKPKHNLSLNCNILKRSQVHATRKHPHTSKIILIPILYSVSHLKAIKAYGHYYFILLRG